MDQKHKPTSRLLPRDDMVCRQLTNQSMFLSSSSSSSSSLGSKDRVGNVSTEKITQHC